MRLFSTRLLLLPCLAMLGLVMPASAGVITYTSMSAFLAATSAVATETFDELAGGFTSNTFTANGIRFTGLPGSVTNHTPYITPAGQFENIPAAQVSTNALGANGDENFQFELVSGDSFHAIGFTMITNAYASPEIRLYTRDGSLIQLITLTQAKNTVGYFGVISDTAIGYATSTVFGGAIQDTGYDDVTIGNSATPEPSAFLLAAGGLAVLFTRRAFDKPVAHDRIVPDRDPLDPCPEDCQSPYLN